MSTSSKIALGVVGAVVVIVLSIVGAVAVIGQTSQAPQPGDVRNTADYYPNGIHLGNQSVVGQISQGVYSADAIQIGPTKNQASWLNTKPTTAYVCEAEAILAGTASSTVKLNVGTSTTASVTDAFSLTTAPFYGRLINATSIATGTASGVVADNGANHASSLPSCIGVPSGQYLLATVSTYCTADGACNTATSSARGWTTLTIPFNYFY